MEGGRERQSETHRQNVCWTYCVSACLGQEIALGQQHSGFEEEEEREKQPERVLVLPAGDRRKHWDSSTVALRRRKRESETHSQSVCWTYCGSTCLGQEIALGQRHSGFGFGPGGRGEMRVGGERETHHQSVCWIYCASACLEQKIGLEQQHSVGCYCYCDLGGTERTRNSLTYCGSGCLRHRSVYSVCWVFNCGGAGGGGRDT